MPRDLRRKIPFSIAAKSSLILTPDILNASRPAHVNTGQPSPLVSLAISATEKHVFLWRHSETVIKVKNGPDQVLMRVPFFRT